MNLGEDKHEYVKQIAHELYQNRVLLARSGNEQSDWQTAEKIVRSPLRTTLFASNRPLIKLEKCVFEPFSKHLRQSAIFDIVDRLSPALEAVGVLLIPIILLWASIAYENQKEAQEIERLQQDIVQNYFAQLSEIFLNVEGDLKDDGNERIRAVATAATVTMLGEPNLSRGRKRQVIDFLSEMELLQGDFEFYGPQNPNDVVIISLHGANLRGVFLYRKSLHGVDLSNAYLNSATLSSAELRGANLNSAHLNRAELRGADLRRADLRTASLRRADLRGADLRKANLSYIQDGFPNYNPTTFITNFTSLNGADLRGADLRGADLRGAIFHGADLRGADLRGADLIGATFYRADLRDADLRNVLLCQTFLPREIDLDRNRDCAELGFEPKDQIRTDRLPRVPLSY